MVCQNTLILALEDGQKAYRVRHTKAMHFRLKELSEFLTLTHILFTEAETHFKRLSGIQLKEAQLMEYLNAVYPRTEIQKKENKEPPKWTYIRELFNTIPNLQLPRVRGTLWGVYNAIIQFEDYRQLKQEEDESQRLERVWFGSGADIKLKALQKAIELSNKWLN